MDLKAVLFLQYSRLALIWLVSAACAAAGFAGAQSPAAAAPRETVLYSFPGGYHGRFTDAGVIFGEKHVLYGTTVQGGIGGHGTVFKLTPPAKGLAQWTETVLHTFGAGNDGTNPLAGLISGTNGALYGTTDGGGTSNNGTVFQLTPPATGQTQWTETVLYSFMGGNDGYLPAAGLIFGENGALYGTTFRGGPSDNGTVFRLAPPAAGQTQWTETVLYSFPSVKDGFFVGGGLIFGENGALYGTTEGGGTTAFGTVFQLTPPATGQTQWTETVLHSFGTGNDGSSPSAGVIFGKDGALYGTTMYGGTVDQFGGTVFQLTPPATGQTQWTETVLYSFTGGNDGGSPAAGLIVGKYGALYGTTSGGGTLGAGTVFQLTPPAKGQTAWSETVLHNFGATGDGVEPVAGLIFGGEREDELYGTTFAGGASAHGTVFLLRR